MKRHEIAAIIGAYSRQGFSAEAVPGGFLVAGVRGSDYRTTKEARQDTGVTIVNVDRGIYRAALNFDLR
jgi:hypothetical protein